MSESLVWMLIKNNNAFLQKRGRTARSGAVQFSSERGNLMNVNSFKYSGLANSKAIDISIGAGGITLSQKVMTFEQFILFSNFSIL
jgi:large subunit ribosomal protein L28e